MLMFMNFIYFLSTQEEWVSLRLGSIVLGPIPILVVKILVCLHVKRYVESCRLIGCLVF